MSEQEKSVQELGGNDLLDYRREIDGIDGELVRLFEKRMRVSEKVAQYKIRTGMPVLDAGREAQKIQSVVEKAEGDFNRQGVKELFHQIMAISRKKQYQLVAGSQNKEEAAEGFVRVEHLPIEGARVVFQGVEGAYSYAAMKKYFGQEVDFFHVKTWREAMECVVEHRADYAVLPIENSTAGFVTDIYDLLMQHELYIVAEQLLSVNHVLLSLPGASEEKIQRVCSHPQALMQCKDYLDQHPGWGRVEMANTAGSAKFVSENADPTLAAIASEEAGRLYGLKVLRKGICGQADNQTRFIILGGSRVYQSQARKVSICFELSHTTGTLYSLLSHIIYNGLNMTKIESRPIQEKAWEYRFFVDFEGRLEEAAVKNALMGIRGEANALRVLGNY